MDHICFLCYVCRGLTLPPLPPNTADEERRFFPAPVAPPRPANLHQAGRLHKTVPGWSAGWRVEYHGNTVYGVSSALACGEIFPSEADQDHNRTACGRGVYTLTSRSHSMACRYSMCHYFWFLGAPAALASDEDAAGGCHSRQFARKFGRK